MIDTIGISPSSRSQRHTPAFVVRKAPHRYAQRCNRRSCTPSSQRSTPGIICICYLSRTWAHEMPTSHRCKGLLLFSPFSWPAHLSEASTWPRSERMFGFSVNYVQKATSMWTMSSRSRRHTPAFIVRKRRPRIRKQSRYVRLFVTNQFSLWLIQWFPLLHTSRSGLKHARHHQPM